MTSEVEDQWGHQKWEFEAWFPSSYLIPELFYFIFYFYFILFRERGREVKREGTKHWLLASHTPATWHLPWPGIKLATPWFLEWHPTHWATPVRARICFKKRKFSYFLQSKEVYSSVCCLCVYSSHVATERNINRWKYLFNGSRNSLWGHEVEDSWDLSPQDLQLPLRKCISTGLCAQLGPRCGLPS